MTKHHNQGNYLKEGAFSGYMESVSCPICKPTPKPTLIFKRSNEVGIWQCPSCEIMYASPRFTEKSLMAIYENPEFLSHEDHKKYLDWTYEKWKTSSARSYNVSRMKVEMIKQYLSTSARILDVGCAMGLFCLEAQKNGFQVEGVEPSKILCDIAHNIVKFPVNNIMLEDFEPEHLYRGIMLWDVLEHVYDPLRLIQRCSELTEPGGYIFIQVPNFEGIGDRIKTFLCQIRLKKCNFKHFGFPWHVYSFNRKSLGRILEQTGYEPIEFESWSHHLKEGKKNIVAHLIASHVRKYCLSDYITCIARKTRLTE